MAAIDPKTQAPTKALLGFAASNGVTVQDLKLDETEKGAWYVFESEEPGKKAQALIPGIIHDAIKALPLPKRMRWGDGDDVFVRPVHWLTLLFNDEVLPLTLFGISSDRFTHGHRFHHPGKIAITFPHEYEELLFKQGKVRADFDKRRKHILLESTIQSEKNHGLVLGDEALLNEVNGLVEWPVVLVGEFETEFLQVPKEALISSMKVHQKCFPIETEDGKLLPKFIIVSNIESKDPKAVIAGNESVMGARLSDAVFHYRVDKEKSLESRLRSLKDVVFQQGLGSLWDKTERVAALTKMIAKQIPNCNFTLAERGALLCKTDLLTQMVGEFPELQGIMGRYYALHDGEEETVAFAIEEHYYPRFANDMLPSTLEGAAVALADRIDTLVGIFGLGKRPTGDKDPFGLRRQALGILRILIEKELNFDLKDLFIAAKELYGNLLLENTVTKNVPIIEPLLDFCFERFRALATEQKVPARVFDAVLARWPTRPLDFERRILAVTEFQRLPEAESLSAANKRVHNILSKSEVPIPPDATFDKTLLKEDAEILLANQVIAKEEEIKPLLKASNYTQALQSLASLKEPIDRFFDKVMVMVDDVDLRNNRIKLLNRLRALFLEIADISVL